MHWPCWRRRGAAPRQQSHRETVRLVLPWLGLVELGVQPLPRADGFEFAHHRLQAGHIVDLAAVTVNADIESAVVLSNARAAGIACSVSKDDPDLHLRPAIIAASEGRSYLSTAIAGLLSGQERAIVADDSQRLSKRESEVLRMHAEGFTVTQIAERIGRSPKTISSQKQSAMPKLGLTLGAEVFDYAVSHGLVAASQIARAISLPLNDEE